MARWETTGGLRLRFRVVEFEEGRVFTDEARLPGSADGPPAPGRAGDGQGCRLTNTIYVDGPLAPLWRRLLGPAAARALPRSQTAIVALAERG